MIFEVHLHPEKLKLSFLASLLEFCMIMKILCELLWPYGLCFNRKREREAEIAVEEEVKAKKEWQKQWDVSAL